MDAGLLDKPLSGLILSDLADQTHFLQDADPCHDDTESVARDYYNNVKHMQTMGARGPHSKVCGYGNLNTIHSTLLEGEEIRGAFWGSPYHPDADEESTTCHVGDTTTFKTNAFHALTYQSKGLVAMTFSAAYTRTSFWHPLREEDASRALVVARMYSRRYHPIASGARTCILHENSTTMVVRRGTLL